MWLAAEVSTMRSNADPRLTLNIVLLSSPPPPLVQEYHSLWAYGNHLRVWADETGPHPHASFDSAVSDIISQECRASSSDRNTIRADLKYVGIVKKIVLVRYGHMRYIVLKCSWIKPNVAGRRQTMRRDEHGFWLVDYNKRQSEESEPFIFPSTVKQVHRMPSVVYQLQFF